jgi:hypothetical protein
LGKKAMKKWVGTVLIASATVGSLAAVSTYTRNFGGGSNSAGGGTSGSGQNGFELVPSARPRPPTQNDASVSFNAGAGIDLSGPGYRYYLAPFGDPSWGWGGDSGNPSNNAQGNRQTGPDNVAFAGSGPGANRYGDQLITHRWDGLGSMPSIPNSSGASGGPYGDTGVKTSAFLATAPVPEPETFAMLLAGLGLLGLVVRRKKSA